MIKQLRYLPFLLVLVSALGFAKHPNHQHLHRDAHNLAAKSSHFAKVLLAKTGYNHLSRDAMALARAAKHFVTTFHNRTDTHRHIARDFAVITGRYNHLVGVFNRAHRVHHNRHIQHDFHAVQAAYNHLAHTVANHARTGRGRGHGHGHGHGGHRH